MLDGFNKLWMMGTKQEKTTMMNNVNVAQESAPNALIDIRGLSKRFGPEQVLRNVDLAVAHGDSLVLIGGSGSGKSLLLKCIAGLVAPTSGTIWIDGKDTAGMLASERQAFEGRFGMLFQRQGLFDSMLVWENVAFRLLQDESLSRSDAREIANEKIRSVGLDVEVGDLSPAELSGGMQKRVGFARAIATDPDILFLDEPTAGLDPIMSNVINEIIAHGVEALGATTISITSDMVSARKISNRIAMIDEGHIIWDGSTMAIDESENPVVERFIRSNVQIFQE
jgi:phospholipid/cholesterol/gamma-HCH transport system ATP-binding protein